MLLNYNSKSSQCYICPPSATFYLIDINCVFTEGIKWYCYSADIYVPSKMSVVSCSISKVELIVVRWRDGKFYRLWVPTRCCAVTGERGVFTAGMQRSGGERERAAKRERETHGHNSSSRAVDKWDRPVAPVLLRSRPRSSVRTLAGLRGRSRGK